MKKWSTFVCLLFVILSISGCEVRATYKFMHDTDQVYAIQIVEAGYEIVDGELEQTIICEIKEKDEFLDSFLKLDCFALNGDPRGIPGGKKVIKVIYCNGDYELIGADGQGKHQNG